MKNIMKKIISTTLLLVIFVVTISQAASSSSVIMSVVDEPICTINFGGNSSFEKRLYSKDLNNKEVTIQLKVTNNEESLKPTGEIMLVIDNSKSMLEPVSNDKNREDLVINSAKILVSNLLAGNDNLKIGAVSFSTNTDVLKEGTIEDARLVSTLTNDVDALLTSISNISYDGPRTNLDSGITLAKQYFTSETDISHKYIIVLSDGVPNVAIDYDKIYFSDDVISKTKTKLQSLSSVAGNVIVMLTGISNGDSVAISSGDTSKTYNQIISEIFGTTTNPTIGKFYYITDAEIEDTIQRNILNDLLPVSQSLKDIKIVDYFPSEIINNFEFAYVEDSNIGTISAEVDKTTNSITWTIPELKSGETAIVKYKLKLNETFDDNIIDKILNTNQKVDLYYTNNNGNTDSKTSDITPKLKLTKVPEEVLPTILPKAGSNTIYYTIIGFSLVIAIAVGIKYISIKNKLK